MLLRIAPRAFAAAFLAIIAACSPGGGNPKQDAAERMVAPVLLTPEARDVSSFARPAEARVSHVALDLRADFRTRRIGGTATLDVQAAANARDDGAAPSPGRRDGGPVIVLDSKGLDIRAVTNAEGQPLRWALGAADPDRGQPLTVQLNGAKRIRIQYLSAPNAEALQWLAPEQTAGKRQPYLFSQGQPTLNRTWIPTQDSPGIRQTWEARIVVPPALKAVMSAENLTPQGEPTEGGRAFRFRMTRPVAPYLIAIAIGDIGFQSLGPRTGVYAEPSMLKAAAAELVDTERMMAAAERMYGEYRWGRYDMIVLPPSFPYGGMENPMLTFLTPTFLAGDRSLVGLVAHELAHSWSGNLVTNATWPDSWLNEGFTSYFENRIMEAIYGPQRARQEAALSWDDMQTAFKEVGIDAPATRLRGDDGPDGGQTGIVYDKGAIFLRTIERIAGRARFDAWLRSYFDRHAFQPMTSARFLADLRRNLVRGDAALEQRLTLDQWVFQPGLPDNVARPDPRAFAQVDQAAAAFGGGGAAAAIPYAGWNTAERLRFLTSLPAEMTQQRLVELDRAFGLSQSGNAELLFAWLKLAVGNRYEPAVPALERFLASMGRRKFVAPLFEALAAEGEWGRPIATRLYARTRPTYHSVTTGTVDQTLAGAG